MLDINQARRELADYNRKGVPVLWSALLYWTALLLLSFFITDEKLLAIIYLYGTGLLLPIGVLFAKWMGIELFRKLNPLSGLSGVLAAVPAIMGPLTVYIFFSDPGALPFAIAIITGGHFFPFAWLYESKAYIFPPVAMMIFCLGSIIVYPELQFLLVPIIVIVSISAIIVGTKMESRNKKLEMDGYSAADPKKERRI